MKIIAAILMILIGVLQYRIWYGEQSYQTIETLQEQIAEQIKQNQLLKEQNDQLKKEIHALRTNPALLEERAREQLGLIKPDETFYRIIPKSDKSKE